MEDKKTKIKNEIKRFATEYLPVTVCAVGSFAAGVFIGNTVYKMGFNAGYDQLADTIYNASKNGGGILLSNKTVGDVIFKATKVLKD